jgi:hypothetical protein
MCATTGISLKGVLIIFIDILLLRLPGTRFRVAMNPVTDFLHSCEAIRRHDYGRLIK